LKYKIIKSLEGKVSKITIHSASGMLLTIFIPEVGDKKLTFLSLAILNCLCCLPFFLKYKIISNLEGKVSKITIHSASGMLLTIFIPEVGDKKLTFLSLAILDCLGCLPFFLKYKIISNLEGKVS